MKLSIEKFAYHSKCNNLQEITDSLRDRYKMHSLWEPYLMEIRSTDIVIGYKITVSAFCVGTIIIHLDTMKVADINFNEYFFKETGALDKFKEKYLNADVEML